MDRSQQSDAFSFEDASQDLQLTLTPSQNDISSTFTPYVETERVKVIWGTTINVQASSDRFKEFIRSSSKYLNILQNMSLTHEFVFPLDCDELEPTLRAELIEYPCEIIPIFQSCLQDIYIERFVETAEIKLRPFNLGKPLQIRNVEPTDIDRIVTLSGMIVRVSGVIPEVLRGLYHCVKCDRDVLVDSTKGVVSEPMNCECGGRLTFVLKHNEGSYADKQVVRIQELPEGIPDGTTPMTLTIVAKDDLVDKIIPGDKVIVTGILKAVPVRVNPIMKKLRSTFRVYIELLHYHSSTTTQVDININLIDSLRKNKNIYNILSNSIAPSIFGMDNVKKALLLQLFGGICKELGSSRLRGDINILLAGDPGIAKSQLLSFVHRLSGRGMYTSGRGSSAVGLTASVSKDPDTGQFILESGALVLSDKGICCVDEFDKMNESTRSVLHEVMEQQTVSIAKAGIITTLNARCSILASCNPIESKYNLKKSIIENINLPSTLLSRFDIVCLLIDKSDPVNDQRVAEHIVGMYTSVSDDNTSGNNTGSDNILNIDVLKDYIKEAKNINPKLTQESISMLSDAYVDLRSLDNGNSITATTRQLESLIRLSEAHARIRFSELVEAEDVNEAVRLIKESLLIYALDPRTGRIDIDMIITGRSASKAKLIEDLKLEIVKIIKKKMLVTEIIEKTKADENLIMEAINELVADEILYFNMQNNSVEKIK